ncbi:hypothetical protein OG426_10285 [Streptomyces canus]|uniref:hypothetical protein n=1 Tax=Streptomyces canus TaxID=58343 RepID=UPI003868EF98|nr:hypothetical protein OG426_10285 [Streptomyces canus]
MSSRRRRGGGGVRARQSSALPASAAGVVPSARAVVFGAVCVVTTALGHALMASGEVLPWWTVSLAFAAAASGGWWLTGRERDAPTVVGATVGAQVLLHLFFSYASRPTGAAGLSDSTGGAGESAGMPGMAFGHTGMMMHHAGMAGGSGTVAGTSGSSLGSVLMREGSAGMFLAHVLAAAVCGLWLWRGERAAHRIGRALAAVLFAPLRRVLRVLFRAPGGRGGRSWRAVVDEGNRRWSASSALRHVVVRRGPPRIRSQTSPLSPDPLLAVRP